LNQKSKILFEECHLFADCGLQYCKLSVLKINQFIEDHKNMVIIGQRPKIDHQNTAFIWNVAICLVNYEPNTINIGPFRG
jgi:hypothetical protein